MNIINSYPVCDGCIYSKLHFCKKYNKECPSCLIGDTRYQICCEDCIDNDAYEQGAIEKEDDKKIALFHIPGFLDTFAFYWSLLQFQHYYPDAFYPNRKIASVYGSFPGAVWNGRSLDYENTFTSLEEIEKMELVLNKYDVNMSLTWNNHLIEGNEVYDSYCNRITFALNTGKHSLIVASEELREYLQSKYMNFNYVKSVISSTEETDITIDKNYDYTVINPKFNERWDLLDELSDKDKKKVIFLCNDNCFPTCTKACHYRQANLAQKAFRCEQMEKGTCMVDQDFTYFNTARWPQTINSEDIDEYVEKGFKHFKITGRGDIPTMTLIKVLKYLVRPEYLDDALAWCLNEKLYPDAEIRKLEK